MRIGTGFLGFCSALGMAGGVRVGRAGRLGETGGEIGAYADGKLSWPVTYEEWVAVEGAGTGAAAGSSKGFSCDSADGAYPCC